MLSKAEMQSISYNWRNSNILTPPGGLLVRPVVVHAVVAVPRSPLQPLHLRLLPHLVVRHLLDRERRSVRRQLRQGPVERQPERLAQTSTELGDWVGRSDNNLRG